MPQGQFPAIFLHSFHFTHFLLLHRSLLVIAQTSNLVPSNFFDNVLCFVLFLFFPFVWIAVWFFTFLIHVLTPVTRKDSDTEITVDVLKIILAFLYFRLVSLTSTGSLIFLSLLTEPFCPLVVYALKKANYGHIKILFTRPFSYFSTKSSLISFKRPFDFPVKILADFISLNPLT